MPLPTTFPTSLHRSAGMRLAGAAPTSSRRGTQGPAAAPRTLAVSPHITLAKALQAKAEKGLQLKKSTVARVRRAAEYVVYCQGRGYSTQQATYQSVAGFLCWWVIKLGGSTASVDQVLSNVRVHFRLTASAVWMSEADATMLGKLVKQLKELDNRQVRRVYALRLWMIAQAITRMDLTDDRQLMTATMLALAQNLLLRTSEIVSGIRVRDVTWGHGKQSLQLHLWLTKTVREGGGVTIQANILDSPTSGLRLLRRWWRRRGLGADPDALVFPAYHAGTRTWAVTPATDIFFRQAVKSAVASIGQNPAHFSGHSCRAGGATDLFAVGTPYYAVKAAGRWKSDVAILYYRSEVALAASIARGFNKACQAAACDEVDVDTVLGCR